MLSLSSFAFKSNFRHYNTDSSIKRNTALTKKLRQITEVRRQEGGAVVLFLCSVPVRVMGRAEGGAGVLCLCSVPRCVFLRRAEVQVDISLTPR